MEIIYKYTGMIVFWLSAIIGILYAFSKILEWTVNFLAKRYQPMWWIMEYLYRRKDFMKYMKGKKRAVNVE